MSRRITAIGAAVLMALLPLALCCSTAVQHACCRDRCAMAADTTPLEAIAPAKPRIDVALATLPSPRTDVEPNSASPLEIVAGTAHLRCDPMATIQLRI